MLLLHQPALEFNWFFFGWTVFFFIKKTVKNGKTAKFYLISIKKINGVKRKIKPSASIALTSTDYKTVALLLC
jgi:hypothetical protein